MQHAAACAGHPLAPSQQGAITTAMATAEAAPDTPFAARYSTVCAGWGGTCCTLDFFVAATTVNGVLARGRGRAECCWHLCGICASQKPNSPPFLYICKAAIPIRSVTASNGRAFPWACPVHALGDLGQPIRRERCRAYHRLTHETAEARHVRHRCSLAPLPGSEKVMPDGVRTCA